MIPPLADSLLAERLALCAQSVAPVAAEKEQNPAIAQMFLADPVIEWALSLRENPGHSVPG